VLSGREIYTGSGRTSIYLVFGGFALPAHFCLILVVGVTSGREREEASKSLTQGMV
jgi:hypothetical protein